MKRAFDFLISIIALILLTPVFFAIAIAIALDSPGGVFYRQTRFGRHGLPFKIYKFRSMISNADKLGSYHTARGDSRITKVGAFLRKTSLDETPQFINVLLGDMSIVGPRPDVPEQEKLYTKEQWQQRHSVRPGITGLAQATIRSEGTWQDRIALDLEYVKTASLRRDFVILMLTVKQVTSKGGF